MSSIFHIWRWSVYQYHTVKPVFKSTWEIGTTWELRTATSGPRSIHHTEMGLRNKTTSEFRIVLYSPLVVPNSQVPLYLWANTVYGWTDGRSRYNISAIPLHVSTSAKIPCIIYRFLQQWSYESGSLNCAKLPGKDGHIYSFVTVGSGQNFSSQAGLVQEFGRDHVSILSISTSTRVRHF